MLSILPLLFSGLEQIMHEIIDFPGYLANMPTMLGFFHEPGLGIEITSGRSG